MAVIKSSLLATAFTCSGLSRSDPDPPPPPPIPIAHKLLAPHHRPSSSHQVDRDPNLGRRESMDHLQLLHVRTKLIFDSAAFRRRGASDELLFRIAASAAAPAESSSPVSPHPPSGEPLHCAISSDFHSTPRPRAADPESDPIHSRRRRYSRSADSGLPDSGRDGRIRAPTAFGRLIGALINSPRSHRNRHRRNNQSLSETDRAQRLHEILVAVQEQLSVVSAGITTNPPTIAQNRIETDNHHEDIDSSNHAIDKDPLNPQPNSVHSMADGNVQNTEPANRTNNDSANENDSVCKMDQADPISLCDDNQAANHDLILDEHRQAELEELFLSYLRLSSPDPSTALTFLHALNPHLITSMNRP